jgi:hypothetical protein
MLAVYSTMIKADLHINTIIVVFGGFVVSTMFAVIWRHHYNQSRGDSLHLIGMKAKAKHKLP